MLIDGCIRSARGARYRCRRRPRAISPRRAEVAMITRTRYFRARLRSWPPRTHPNRLPCGALTGSTRTRDAQWGRGRAASTRSARRLTAGPLGRLVWGRREALDLRNPRAASRVKPTGRIARGGGGGEGAHAVERDARARCTPSCTLHNDARQRLPASETRPPPRTDGI